MDADKKTMHPGTNLIFLKTVLKTLEIGFYLNVVFVFCMLFTFENRISLVR